MSVDPTETRAFACADEGVVEMQFGYATFALESTQIIAPVIFADEESGLVLGALTLEAVHSTATMQMSG